MKKILSLLLSVCLVVTLIPVISFAADDGQGQDDGYVTQMGEPEGNVDPDAVDPDAVDPDTVDPDAVDSDAVDPDVEAASGEEMPGVDNEVEPEVVEGQSQLLNESGNRDGEDPWKQEDGKWRYYVNGNYLTGMQVIGGATYLFSSPDGYMLVGLQTYAINNCKYFFSTSGSQPGAVGSNYGAMMSGQIINVPNLGRCYFNPEMKFGWQTIGGSKYYFNTSNGVAVTGKQLINGSYYFFNANGVMQTGWQGKNYFNPSNGKMQIGWATIGSSRYYFNNSGLAVTGWQTIAGNKYYFNASGVMQTGWMTIKKNKYYLNPSSGAMAKGWTTIGKKKYFFNTKNGAMVKGWLKYKKKKYFLNKKTGVMYTGLKKISKAKYFFNKKNGAMKTNGTEKISGKVYYFLGSGKMRVKVGWFTGKDKKKRYCLSTKGYLATGKKKIGSNWYIFSKTDGSLTKSLGDDLDQKVQSLSSATSYLIAIKRSTYEVRVYTGSKNNWTRVKKYKCAIGTDATPTKTGTYTISNKGVKNTYTAPDGTQTRYWYWCYYTGTQGVHSGLYYDGGPNDGQDYDTRVGVKSTNGGIRVDYSNAKWIYNNVPVGTKVVVY